MIVVFLVITEDRNNLEKLTLAVLTHLPTAVLYVHDLTGECGTSPSDQVYSKTNPYGFHCIRCAKGSTRICKMCTVMSFGIIGSKEYKACV